MFRVRVSTRLAAVLFVIFTSPLISAAEEPAEAGAARVASRRGVGSF